MSNPPERAHAASGKPGQESPRRGGVQAKHPELRDAGGSFLKKGFRRVQPRTSRSGTPTTSAKSRLFHSGAAARTRVEERTGSPVWQASGLPTEQRQPISRQAISVQAPELGQLLRPLRCRTRGLPRSALPEGFANEKPGELEARRAFCYPTLALGGESG
jgi:hypothetical protein